MYLQQLVITIKVDMYNRWSLQLKYIHITAGHYIKSMYVQQLSLQQKFVQQLSLQ